MVCAGYEFAQGFIVVTRLALHWCWQDVQAATYYEVREAWNGATPALVGSTIPAEWHSTASLWDDVWIDYRACNETGCSDWSPQSQPILVRENFDANGDGMLGAYDFDAFRASTRVNLSWLAYRFNALRLVLGNLLVNGIYFPPGEQAPVN